MKKFFGLFLVCGLVFLTSCQTTREISINEKGGGSLVTTNDMSSLIGFLQMAGKEMDPDEKSVDTTINLDKMVDSLPELNAEEKALVGKGRLGLQVDFKKKKMLTRLEFPFDNSSQIKRLDEISSRVMRQVMSKQADGGENAASMPQGEMLESSIDDYFTMKYDKGVIERKHIPEKYAKVGEDEGLQSLKEATASGMPMTNTLIINLPRPAKKVEGKNVKLSEDKKQVTIATTLEDFFDDVSKMDFRIEY